MKTPKFYPGDIVKIINYANYCKPTDWGGLGTKHYVEKMVIVEQIYINQKKEFIKVPNFTYLLCPYQVMLCHRPLKNWLKYFIDSITSKNTTLKINP